MKIVVLQGSPRIEGNTAGMVEAFKEGAERAGHEVVVFPVALMSIGGCLACEKCHAGGNGSCVLNDDMQEIYPHYREADMIVFASPVYYGSFTGQLHCAIDRTYCISIPEKCKKTALILSSGASGVYANAEGIYRGFLQGWYGAQDCGVFEAAGAQARSEGTLRRLREFGESL